jgi:Ca-activated chloride channel family protein
MSPLLHRLRALALILCATSLFLACGQKDAPSADAQSDKAFTILAGSEVKDLEPLIPAVEQATGLKLRFKYTGTLDAVERIQGGEQFDAAWLASNRYALLTPGVKEKVLASERTMLTPVVLGIKRSKAQGLGWADAAGKANPAITWKDIAQAAEKGRFTFAMTNPSASNTGFAGLIGVAAALADKGDALEVKDVNASQLTAFFKAQTLTAGSSGWLADAYVQEQGRIDGMINYASTLLALNAGGKLAEPLVLIYPKEGIITADYPFMLLNPAKRADYDKLLAHLRSSAFQTSMSKQTFRKPVAAEVPLDAMLYPSNLIELPFPAKLAVIDAVLQAFDNEIRRPADSSFVLDISGSMGGKRMEQMKTALLGLTGLDTSLSGRFARLRERETISMTAFDNWVRDTQTFDMGRNRREATESDIRSYVQQLQADGGTAVFTAAQAVYQEAAARRAKAPDRYYSIVFLTDGESNQGLNAADFEAWYQSLPASEKGIRIFAIQFGEARAEQLESLARLTGGRVFNATKTPLAQVFKEIRGYQ